MERRKAVTAAAAASLTLLAGAAGMALSSNIVGVGANDDVGQLSPVASTTDPPVTIWLDDQPVTTHATAPAPAPRVQTTVAPATTASTASGVGGAGGDDDREDVEDHEDQDEAEDHGVVEDDEQHEVEQHEYEGRDDDD